jgi:hypothetical protein
MLTSFFELVIISNSPNPSAGVWSLDWQDFVTVVPVVT